MLTPASVESFPSRRRAPGRGNELTHLEREEANRLWVQGASKATIARTLNTTTAAVRRALTCPQGEAFQADARTELRKRRGQFVRDWCRASEVAADMGSHRPARDALIACGEVDPQPAGGNVMTVQILNNAGQSVTLPGLPPATTHAPALPVVPVRRALPEPGGE